MDTSMPPNPHPSTPIPVLWLSQHSDVCIGPSVWSFVLPVCCDDLNISQPLGGCRDYIFFFLWITNASLCGSLCPPTPTPLPGPQGRTSGLPVWKCTLWEFKRVMTRLLPPITDKWKGDFMEVEQGSFLTGWKGWCQRATLNCTIVTSNTYFRENLRPSEGWKLHLVRHGPQLVPGAHLTQFTFEAPPNCSYRLFNHSAQIIQPVSPQSPCPYVRDFLSLLCVVQRSIS